MNERLLGLIPARRGSKRVPDKNGRAFAGTSLLGWAVRQGLQVAALNRLGLSTDSPAYLDIARREGLEETYLRPDNLATDQANSAEMALDYVDWLAREHGEAVSHVVLLQPTSPFRLAKHIDAAVGQWRRSGRPSLVSVTPAAPDSRFLVRRAADGRVERLDAALAPVYVLEGSIYITPVEMLRAGGRFWEQNSELFVVEHPHAFDIDTPEDFVAAEAMIASRTNEEAP